MGLFSWIVSGLGGMALGYSMEQLRRVMWTGFCS